MSQNINNINNEATVGAVAQLAQLGAGAVGAVKGAYAQHKAQKKAKKEKEEDLKMKEETRQLNKFDVAYENVMSKLYVPLSEDEHKEKGFFAKAGDLAGKAAKLAALAGAGYGIYKLGGAAKEAGSFGGGMKKLGGDIKDFVGKKAVDAGRAINPGAALPPNPDEVSGASPSSFDPEKFDAKAYIKKK